VDDHLAVAPVDVIQRQGGQLAAPQPEPQQRDEDRVVAAPERAAAITRRQQRRGVGPADPARQRPGPPPADRQSGPRQVDRHQSLDHAEPQKRPHAADEVVRRADRHDRRLAQHRPGHLSRRQLGQPAARQPGQEPARVRAVRDDRAGRQPALAEQIPLKRRQQQVIR
jgi:hypothetical protein